MILNSKLEAVALLRKALSCSNVRNKKVNEAAILLQAPCGISHKLGTASRQLRARKSVIPPQSDAAVASVAVTADEPENKKLIFGIAPLTWQKIIPLGFMFFCILFNYTILRDTKVRGYRLLWNAH